jgi:hypothetical protein
MGQDFSPKTIWNFDEARMRELHFHLVICEEAFENWNIGEINKKLYTIRRIISGAMGETDWNSLIEDFQELEGKKRKFESSELEDEHNKSNLEFYKKADEILLKINRFLKKKGMCFREGEDPRYAALKR